MLFCIGLWVMASKRNAIGVLIGVELILNASNINLLAFARYSTGGMNGHLIALFVIVLAAAEAAIAIAIVVNLYKNFMSVDVDKAATMKN
ncbi:MAG: NADH-quinone oxidoreductase subunit K [Phycisphaerae bacterium]|nr:NADH-quinone oxidoreductase subunit K [Phycisphaerae bacterium]